MAVDLGVGENRYSGLLEICGSGVVDFFRLDEEDASFCREVEECGGHGVAVHVAAADVERPGDFVERGYEGGIGTLFGCLGQDFCDFRGCGLAGVFHVVDEHHGFGQVGAVFPDGVGSVEIGGEGHAAFL